MGKELYDGHLCVRRKPLSQPNLRKADEEETSGAVSSVPFLPHQLRRGGMCPGAQLGRDRGPRPRGPPVCPARGQPPAPVSWPVLKGGAAEVRPWDSPPVCSGAGLAPACVSRPRERGQGEQFCLVPASKARGSDARAGAGLKEVFLTTLSGAH